MGRKRGRRAESKKAKAKAKTEAAGKTRPLLAWKLTIELPTVEMAAGHDGLLRGLPEPVLLFGAYLVTSLATSPRVKPLGRALVRLVPEGKFPLAVAPLERTVLKGRGRSGEGDRIVLIAIALEEDNGKDVERVYAHLGEGAMLRAWDVDAPEPSPHTVAELAGLSLSAPPFGTRVHVLDEGMDLRDSCTGDKLVGAGVIVLPAARGEEGFRVRFVSTDHRNDWTAILGLSIG